MPTTFFPVRGVGLSDHRLAFTQKTLAVLYPALHSCSYRFAWQPPSVKFRERRLSSHQPSAPVRFCGWSEQVPAFKRNPAKCRKERNGVSVCLFAMLWLQCFCITVYCFSIIQAWSNSKTEICCDEPQCRNVSCTVPGLRGSSSRRGWKRRQGPGQPHHLAKRGLGTSENRPRLM